MENIERVNQAVVARKKGENSQKKMLTEIGLPEDSIMLSNLDDWRAIYSQLNE